MKPTTYSIRMCSSRISCSKFRICRIIFMISKCAANESSGRHCTIFVRQQTSIQECANPNKAYHSTQHSRTSLEQVYFFFSFLFSSSAVSTSASTLTMLQIYRSILVASIQFHEICLYVCTSKHYCTKSPSIKIR